MSSSHPTRPKSVLVQYNTTASLPTLVDAAIVATPHGGPDWSNNPTARHDNTGNPFVCYLFARLEQA